jgi:hypothetical protein
MQGPSVNAASNYSVEPTPYSVRCAPASGRGSGLALGLLKIGSSIHAQNFFNRWRHRVV